MHPTIEEIIKKELLPLKDISKEELGILKEYKIQESRKNLIAFLKRHKEDKERFKREIQFNVGEYILISPNYPQNTCFYG